MANIEITHSPTGKGQIIIDGVDIANAVHSVQVMLDASGTQQVVVYLSGNITLNMDMDEENISITDIIGRLGGEKVLDA